MALYWISNLVLWFPWSINEWLGMTLMLTVSPVLWGFGVFQCLIKFSGEKIIKAALVIAIIFTSVAIISDYIFFGIIRQALDKLYHPTTFYGYGFLLFLPFIEILILPGFIKRKKESLSNKDFRPAVILAFISLLALTLIIKLHIEI